MKRWLAIGLRMLADRMDPPPRNLVDNRSFGVGLGGDEPVRVEVNPAPERHAPPPMTPGNEMSRASDRLREFHEAFDVDLNFAQRIRLASEENVELILALVGLDEAMATGEDEVARRMEVARELADVMVVTYGTAEVLGIDLDAAFDAVMDSNMSKMPDDGKPLKRADGKILKGPSFVEPDMSGAIR